MREFNVTGLCVPGKHYMADTSEKIAAIMALIDKGHYFSINCARQYGKTTTLNLIEKGAPAEYTMIRLSFEGVDDEMFDNAAAFCQGFLSLCSWYFERKGSLPESGIWKDDSVNSFQTLSKFLTKICRVKKYVLLIDEVDKSSNNTIFLKFLGMLRDKYLLRGSGDSDTFHSVILAGVYNIKNLKMKMVQAGTHQLQDGEARINSPWNIAIDFEVDMSLSVKEISSMLTDYESDHKTGMDIEAVAQEIRSYTNGYPYLVSRICQRIEDKLDRDWTVSGVERAIKIMLSEDTTLIDDIFKNLNNNKDLDDLMFNIIALGKKYKYNRGNFAMDLGLTFGFLLRQGDDIIIGNKFFETLLYIHYAQRLEIEKKLPTRTERSDVISEGKFNMQLAIEKFARHYYEIYRDSLKEFLESECRLLFITYIQPLINGGGFYHVESETRDAKRMDVVIDYGADQFIVELKIWYGDAAHEKALDQIAGYLERKNKDTGYLITFDFRKDKNTDAPEMEWVEHNGKKIFDVIMGN